jgi:uroporphyrin-III C-methyltransferase
VLTTARTGDGALAGDWRAAADPEATLAVYMAAAAAAGVRAQLLAAGRDGATPAVAVENAGRPDARLAVGTLATLADLAHGAMAGPVLLVVGEAAAMARPQPASGSAGFRRAAAG